MVCHCNYCNIIITFTRPAVFLVHVQFVLVYPTTPHPAHSSSHVTLSPLHTHTDTHHHRTCFWNIDYLFNVSLRFLVRRRSPSGLRLSKQLCRTSQTLKSFLFQGEDFRFVLSISRWNLHISIAAGKLSLKRFYMRAKNETVATKESFINYPCCWYFSLRQLLLILSVWKPHDLFI